MLVRIRDSWHSSSHRPLESRPSSLPAQDPESPRTILICEDESALRELIRISLGSGYRFLEAASGDEALALASAEHPDLVLLDLMLPRMSGMDVLAHLRGAAASATMPVAAISAWTDMEAEALAAGADRFIAKPFDPILLREEVEEMLAR